MSTFDNDGAAPKANGAGEESGEADQPPSQSGPSPAHSDHASSDQTGSTALVPVSQPGTDIAVAEGPGGWLARLFGLRKRAGTDLRADLADALSGDVAGPHSFSAEEKLMLNNILRLQDVRVEDLMVPRADIEAVEITIPLGELLKIFEDSGHSRMPVYADTLDDPRGMVHIRDVVAHITQTAAMTKTEIAARKKPLAANLDLKKVSLEKPLGALKIVRKVLFVPPSMLAVTLMARMQATRTQMALVIDEYGGTEGIVSLEDIVEAIVGDIEDEHDDDDEPMILDKGDGVFVIDAKAELEDVAEAVGADFEIGEHGEDADTIGGLVFALIGRVPLRGEVIEGLGFEFRVVDADPRRIKRIELLPAKRRRVRKTA